MIADLMSALADYIIDLTQWSHSIRVGNPIESTAGITLVQTGQWERDPSSLRRHSPRVTVDVRHPSRQVVDTTMERIYSAFSRRAPMDLPAPTSNPSRGTYRLSHVDVDDLPQDFGKTGDLWRQTMDLMIKVPRSTMPVPSLGADSFS